MSFNFKKRNKRSKMSRLSPYYEEDKSMSVEHDDNFSSLGLNKEDRTRVVVAFDADYLIYFALYSKDKDGNVVEWTIDRIEELQGKLSEMFLKVLNNLEKYFDLGVVYTFIRGKGNFRRDLCKIYKSKRPEKHPLTDILYDWLKTAHGAIESTGAESDDYCATVCYKTQGNCIVVSPDKDLLQLSCIIYNPQKDYYRKITPKEAKFQLYMQYVCGDVSDSVAGCKGLGIAYYNKNFHIDMTDEEYETALLTAYIKSTKGDETEAKRQMELNKLLLTLKYME